MSSGASPTPQLVFQIAKVAVYSEVAPREVATAPEGIVTHSFGPTQIALQNAHTKTPLQPGEPYNIRAGTPHDYDATNMIYVGKLENGGLLFRAPTTKA